MKLYNTLHRQLENFRPQHKGRVKIYTCGPTVYNYQHIGNYAAFIYWDLLVRTLQAHHYQVNRILNLTNVGHLASDADDGEDKLEKGARREGKTVWEVAEFYTEDFLRNFRTLNLVEPTKITRATDYINAGLNLVQTLTQQGYTYQTDDGIYFDTSKFPSYADFAKLDLDHLKAGARIDFNPAKRHPSDFAIWKFVKAGEKHTMQWKYLDKPGYPGWHLECSSIIHQELGEPIDIHTGGIDHIPVHHSNEIAQSEAAYGKKLAHFWLHCNFIKVDGAKISKSLGNTYTLQDLAAKAFSPLDFKFWVLQGHYQSERNFSFTDLTAAQQRRLSWRNRIATLYQPAITTTPTPSIQQKLLNTLDNNLNSAAAFAIIDNSSLSLDDWQFVDQLFGLNLVANSPQLTPAQEKLIQVRSQARQAKDYAQSDQLRDALAQQNINIVDSPTGPIWQYLK